MEVEELPQPMRHEHGFQEATPVDEARRRLLELIEPIDRHQSVALEASTDRVLAEEVVATREVPHYDRAAMDGWALRAADTHGASRRSPRTLRVVDDGAMAADSAVRVHTGSPMPDGADAVVMIEDATRLGDTVEVTSAVSEGRHVGEAGEDVQAGQVVLEAGATVTPSGMSLLRSLEVDEVTVYERPEVAVIPTGEELVESNPEPGEVIETNGLMLSQYVASWGGTPRYREIVTDDRDAIIEAIERDLDADLILTTGGSSVGERDLLPEVVVERGELALHGVAIQPGHPVGFGRVDATPIVLVPGYPVSCVVNAVQLVRPAIRHLGHLRHLPYPTIECELAEKIHSSTGKRTFTRVHLEQSDGRYLARPAMTSGAGILSSMAQTDAVVEVPERLEGYNKGEVVEAAIWE